LPKTVIRLKVTVERETFAKGPYYQYAESYLGLSDVISEDDQRWRISDVQFETYPIIDTNNVYLVETMNPEQFLQINLNKYGFVESLNSPEPATSEFYSQLETGNSTKKSSENIELYQKNKVTFDDIPVPKEIISKKTISEQASALANKILVLRDDRSALLVGDGYTQALPAGETMKTMISEIDKTLENYMLMFKGKVVKETFTYQYDFTPIEPRKITQAIIFRFSDHQGIVDNSDISGTPVIIEIESYENLKELEQFMKRQYYLETGAGKNETEKGFYYRIPEMGIVRLMKNERLLKEDKIQIAQFGSVQTLPLKYLDGKYCIRFFPELGSLKSISLNKIEEKKKENKK
jgi:hypothetical protein